MTKRKETLPKKEAVFPAGEVMSMLEHMNEGIQVIAETQGQVFNKLDTIDGRLNNLQDDVTDIKFKLSDKVDRGEFEKLEKRVIKVERAVFSRKS